MKNINIYGKPRNIPFDKMDMSIPEFFTKYARYISSQNSESEAKAFIGWNDIFTRKLLRRNNDDAHN